MEERPVDAEERLKELERGRIEVETSKLRAETKRMDRSNTIDVVKLVLTAAGVAAAMVVALDTIGLI